MAGPPEEVRALAARRAGERDARNFAAADLLRDRIAEAGWSVVDEPQGWRLEPTPAVTLLRPADVASVLEEPPTADMSLHWVVESWPEDVDRAIASFRSTGGGRSIQFVVADVTGEPAGRWGPGVEVVSLEHGTGWAAARNAGLRRSRGATILALDGSVEATGDVLGALEAALSDSSVGVCGPFGIVTEDLREFREAPGPGDCDAVEGYLMAFRRETLRRAGGFDERFHWYRSADIEWCFRVRDSGLRVTSVPAPVVRHAHRMWEAATPQERDRLSRRNFGRFLDRWRDRWDLTVRGRPPEEDA
jgi:cysteinyl-tRNA synthetase